MEREPMAKEEILKGIECCAEYLCGECPYQKYESTQYLLKCNTALMRDINELLKNTALPPAYVGQTIYRIRGKWGYPDGADTSDMKNFKILSYYVVEGKVSMIQQKANKTWKIRMSEGGSVSDYTTGDIGEWIFFNKEAADKKAEEKTNGLSGL